MNFLELQQQVRSMLIEEDAAFWSDNDIKRFVNDADLQVIIEIQGGDVYRTSTSVKGQASYYLPVYTLEINGVLYDDKPLIRLTGNQEVLQSSEGSPSGYWLPKHSDRVYLSPVPDAAGKVIKLTGRFKSDDMAEDTDRPESPSVLHRAIIYYASMLAWQKRKDGNQAASMFGLYRMTMDTWDGPVDAGPMMMKYGGLLGSYSGRR